MVAYFDSTKVIDRWMDLSTVRMEVLYIRDRVSDIPALDSLALSRYQTKGRKNRGVGVHIARTRQHHRAKAETSGARCR